MIYNVKITQTTLGLEDHGIPTSYVLFGHIVDNRWFTTDEIYDKDDD